MAKFNTNKILKICLICYAAILAAGIIVTALFGVRMDINFRGGARVSYSYKGDIKETDVTKEIKGIIKQDFKVSRNTALAGDTKTIIVELTGRNSLTTDNQEAITEALTEKFPTNSIELYDSNSVSPSVAGTFLTKSLVAVLLTAILVIIYVGIRFRKIGGVSAAVTALCAVVLDLLVSFVTCVIFRLQIDSNYMAVVLTILGYSLNDTIVVYDRVRENKRLYPQNSIRENVNLSIAGIFRRNIITTVTTILAVITIIVVSEPYGLTTLRTFAIPMVFSLLSGCISSLFVAGPLWVLWREHMAAKKQKSKP